MIWFFQHDGLNLGPCGNRQDSSWVVSRQRSSLMLVLDAWVEVGVEQIDDQVEDCERECDEQHRALYHGIVAPDDRV